MGTNNHPQTVVSSSKPGVLLFFVRTFDEHTLVGVDVLPNFCLLHSLEGCYNFLQSSCFHFFGNIILERAVCFCFLTEGVGKHEGLLILHMLKQRESISVFFFRFSTETSDEVTTESNTGND